MVCKLFGHQRSKSAAWYDGMDWRSDCKRCRAPMIRDGVRGVWRAFNRETDFHLARSGRPIAG